MNTVDLSTAARLRARVGRLTRFTRVFGHLSLQAIWNWQKARMTYRAVGHLNNHILQDIGLDRSAVRNPLYIGHQESLAHRIAKAYRQAKDDLQVEVNVMDTAKPVAANDAKTVAPELSQAA